MDSEQEELCLIDSRIKSLHQVPLRTQFKSINLHCNQISRIEGLDYLQHLRHLDLSSNQITYIEGLDYLVSLRSLNLACNLIDTVNGLQNLKKLVKINLSYNQITSVVGFQNIRGNDYSLQHIELHGNRLTSAKHIVQCLAMTSSLQRLDLCCDSASNPVSDTPGYRSEILTGLPMLNALDGRDRQGRPVASDDALATLPGLEKFIDYLSSNNNSMVAEAHAPNITTPAIDAALEKFRQRVALNSDLSTSATVTSDLDLTQASKQSKPADQSRLEKLENQLAELLQLQDAARSNSKLKAKRDIDDTDESETETKKSGNSRPGVGRKGRGATNRSYQRSTACSRWKTNKTASGGDMDDSMPVRGRSTSPAPRSSASTPERSSSASHGVTKVTGVKKGAASSSELSSSARQVPLISTHSEDQAVRDDLKNTYVSLMGELERERERRWKAEAATKRLLQHVCQLQAKDEDVAQTQELSSQTTERLRTSLATERQAKLKLEAEVEVLQEQLSQEREKLEKAESLCEQSSAVLRSLQQTQNEREAQAAQFQARQAKKLQETGMRTSAAQKELEIVREQNKQLQGQLHQLQELLAAREQEHRKELQGRYSVESREFQDMLARETAKLEKLHSQELNIQQQRVEGLREKYAELEDEFRLALHMENKRFTELEEAYKSLSGGSARERKERDTLQRKEEQSSQMVTELTQLVKEQKGRISELAKAKAEQTAECRERVGTLEAHLEEARKRMVQLELLKQEKVKLSSQVQAQESVIQGLKAERRLWGEELAQQGAALGQDRGRMEAKIEQLNSEVTQLKRQLDREVDGVKIKTKIIEDQTESIKKLKDGLLERDEEVRQLRAANLKQQQEHEAALSAEVAATAQLHEQLERARGRKEELKQQLGELEDKLIDTERAHSELSSQWKQKSNAIAELERQVSTMRNSWLAKEKKLTEERDKALEAARIAVDRIKSMDDAFRQQLDAKEQNHSERMRKVQQEASQQVTEANQRVMAVEQEMRDLLSENEATKRGMEDKVKKLTRAMIELQQGLF